MPGLEIGSWGYHNDDGKSYSGNPDCNTYGPTFTIGDVVGCCIDFHRQLIFYTKNGELLDCVFLNLTFDTSNKPVKDDIYPFIGLNSIGQHVHVNFGKEPFVFDVTEYLQTS